VNCRLQIEDCRLNCAINLQICNPKSAKSPRLRELSPLRAEAATRRQFFPPLSTEHKVSSPSPGSGCGGISPTGSASDCAKAEVHRVSRASRGVPRAWCLEWVLRDAALSRGCWVLRARCGGAASCWRWGTRGSGSPWTVFSAADHEVEGPSGPHRVSGDGGEDGAAPLRAEAAPRRHVFWAAEHEVGLSERGPIASAALRAGASSLVPRMGAA